MDWSTLMAVVVGGFIAVIPVIISNRFQARERDKNREEQRREAKIELALERTRNDIKIIEDTVDNTLKALVLIPTIHLRKLMGKLSDDEMREEIFSIDGKVYELVGSGAVADKVAYALGDEIFSAYTSFNDISLKYTDMYMQLKLESFSSEHVQELFDEIIRIAGRLHAMLAEKLISTRDTYTLGG